MILPDNPILEDSQDKLRRAPLALKVSELVKNFQGGESFVIGIEGPWGAGKSSFLNLVLNDLGNAEDVIILTFNPWNFTGQNELLIEFFSSLSNALGGKFSKTFFSYANKLQVSLSPSINIPFFGSVGIGELWKKGGATLQEDRKKIDGELRKLNKKIVVVIDDIDRLDKLETRLIMKLVKMTANFPNTIFLLAYDRDRVAERLNEDGWPGDEYLKKIIQVSFTLPEPDKQQLLQVLFSDLDKTIEAVYGEVRLEDESEKRWGELLYEGFRDLFKTIRDIKRFISSLRLNWSIMGKDEINPVDFIGIEAIRVFSPKFYSAIAANKSLFTETTSHQAGSYSRDETSKLEIYKELTKLIPDGYAKAIGGVTKVLFPQVDEMSYGNEWQGEWRKENRICAEERFDFYFQLGVPRGEVSGVEAKDLITSLSDPKLFSEKVLKMKEEGKLRKTFPRLVDSLDSLDEKSIKNLIKTFWDLEKSLSEEKEEMFDFDDPTTWVGRLSYQGLKRIPKGNRLKIARELLENSKTLEYPARFIAIEDEGMKKRLDDEKLFSQEELDSLKKIMAKKISDSAVNQSLLEEYSFIRLLFLWARWEGKENVEKYISELLEQKGVVFVLKKFVFRVLSTAGNYNSLKKENIGELYPIEKVDALVARISEKDLEGMTVEEKEAVDLYRNPRKDF